MVKIGTWQELPQSMFLSKLDPEALVWVGKRKEGEKKNDIEIGKAETKHELLPDNILLSWKPRETLQIN